MPLPYEVTPPDIVPVSDSRLNSHASGFVYVMVFAVPLVLVALFCGIMVWVRFRQRGKLEAEIKAEAVADAEANAKSSIAREPMLRGT